MQRILKFLFFFLFCFSFCGLKAQNVKWRDMYQVKKKDTIYGIAKSYNITVDELVEANPDLANNNYVLKKDEYLFIPYHKDANAGLNETAKKIETATVQTVEVAKKGINVGVMLPLHDKDGDGKRMIEYYRGVLMACENLKKENISVNVRAWNLAFDSDVNSVLSQLGVDKCDFIIGPLYTKHVKPLVDFCKPRKIKLVIPFSITDNDVASNGNIFQVYQEPSKFTERSIDIFLSRFSGSHVVFVDCNDTTSRKGIFTFGLRKKLEQKGIAYSITNLKSSDGMFAKSFHTTKPNVVILNTGRSPELNSVLAKLDILKSNYPNVAISIFGYTEWLMYTKVYNDYFFKYDTYIPTAFYYNGANSATQNFEKQYLNNFKTNMQLALPRFAITGFDHANFFIKGFSQYNKSFTGSASESTYKALQTPLKFVRVSKEGGLRNNAFMLIHYLNNRTVQAISY